MAGVRKGTPPRDLVGHGQTPPNPQWPGGAYVAVQFVVNYEEGGENCVLNGDEGSEWLLSEIGGAESYKGQRHINMETLYEYGSRAGFWRLHREFTKRHMPVTVYAVAKALELNPAAGKAMVEAGWEVASHGYRWIDYQNMPEAEEREHIRKAVEIHTAVTGSRPLGLYQGKPNERTRRLLVEEGGFVYDSDSYNDDLPYYDYNYGRPHLIIPYTLDVNDMKFVASGGFTYGDQFFHYLKDAFDQLYEEGQEGAPKMLTIGLHCRVVARPGRIRGLTRFLDYVRSKQRVWVARRIDIARHWLKTNPPKGGAGAVARSQTSATAPAPATLRSRL